MGPYLNRQDLADALVSAVTQLLQAQKRTGGTAFSVRSTRTSSQRRVDDRLSEADRQRLIAAFTAGTSKRKLADRYGISESSVKRLIRQRGASKPSSRLHLGQGRYRLGLYDQGLWPVSG
jgi:DNA invertase Pin-like site-specific DNA recombinase